MCFKKIIQTAYVEDPSFSTPITIGKDPDGKNAASATEVIQLATHSANQIVANIIVQDALAEAAKYSTVTLKGLDSIARLRDRSVVLMGPTEHRLHLLKPHVHPDQLWVSSHTKLDGKVIVLQLADFSCLAEYSLGPHRPQKPMPENALLHWELRIKTHLTSESGKLYERAPGWEELLIAMREDK